MHSRQYYWARTNRRKDSLARLGWHMNGPVPAQAQQPYNPLDPTLRDPPQPAQMGGPPVMHPSSLPLDPPPHPHALPHTHAHVSAALHPEMDEAQAHSPAAQVSQGVVNPNAALSERQVRQIKRLPADIRAQVQALQVWTPPLALQVVSDQHASSSKRWQGLSHRLMDPSC